MALDRVSESCCSSCKKEVKIGDKALMCEGSCQSWFHIKCVNVSPHNYKKIQDLGDIIRWFCEPCRVVVTSLVEKHVTSTTVQPPTSVEQVIPCDQLSFVLNKLEIINKNYAELTQCVKKIEDGNPVPHRSVSLTTGIEKSTRPSSVVKKLIDKIEVRNPVLQVKESLNSNKMSSSVMDYSAAARQIKTDKCQSRDDCDQCTDHNDIQPFETIVLQPEVVLEEVQQDGEIVKGGRQAKKEEVFDEKFTLNSSHRFTVKTEHLKEENVESLEEVESDEEYQSSTEKMEIEYILPDRTTANGNLKSENKSIPSHTQYSSTELIVKQEISTFLQCYDTSQDKSLSTHNAPVHATKSYTCEYCNKTMTYKSAFTRHLRTHTRDRPYSCQFCNRKFSEKKSLATHLHTHTGDKPYKCKFCDKSFNDRSNLSKHLRIHTGEKPYSCNYCDKSFTINSTLVTHLYTHTGSPYNCEVCDKSFNGKSKLAQHLRIHSEEFVRSGERYLTCELCDKSFTQKSSLTAHLHTHTGEKPYSCKFCDKSFNKNSNLKTHLILHTGERPYICELCGKSFTYKCTLDSHLRLHTGEKPYICQFCDRSFTHKSTLRTHILTHTGEKPHKCEFCDKSFSQKSTLNTHLPTHTGEKPFKCKFCDKSFSDRSTLANHVRTHTGERPHKCKFCDKSFTQKSNLKLHLRTHTGDRP